jgi:hypothetical protein
MAVTYIKLGPIGDIFSSEELGIFLTKTNAVEVNDDLTYTRLKAFFLTGFLVRITKVEYDNVKLNGSVARNIPLVMVDISPTPTPEPVESILQSPPANPIRNKRYLIWDKPTGSWETYENCIAWFTGSDWSFIIPTNGMSLPVYSLGLSAKYTGTYPSGVWTVGTLENSEVVTQVPTPEESRIDSIPSWILGITEEDIERWNNPMDYQSLAESLGLGTDLTLDNEHLLKSLNLDEGYLKSFDNGIKVAYADNAYYWDLHVFDDYIDQHLTTESDVRFHQISSKSFISGFMGNGWRIDGNGDATFDNLTVRKEFNVYELVINKISGSNGAIAVTDSAELSDVLQSENGLEYICQIDTKDNTIQVPFRVDDILRCQRWNGESIKYYLARVTSVANGSFNISKTLLDGGDIPFRGDSVHRFGNISDSDRQGLLYLTSSDDYSPYMDIYDGVDSADLMNKIRVRLGRLDGIIDEEMGQLSGYGLYTDNGYFRGNITAKSGKIGTWIIDAEGMKDTTGTAYILSSVPGEDGGKTEVSIGLRMNYITPSHDVSFDSYYAAKFYNTSIRNNSFNTAIYAEASGGLLNTAIEAKGNVTISDGSLTLYGGDIRMSAGSKIIIGTGDDDGDVTLKSGHVITYQDPGSNVMNVLTIEKGYVTGFKLKMFQGEYIPLA